MNPSRFVYRAVYRMLTRIAAPFAVARLNRRAADHPEFRARTGERRGRVAHAGGEVWVHAASAGEVNAAASLIDRLARATEAHGGGPGIVISTHTHTGALRAEALFGARKRVRHVFAPLDTPGAVARWLDRTRPVSGLIVETEIWPELFGACRARGIRLALVNARISSRAFQRYCYLRGLFAPALEAVDLALCQSVADAERLAAMGLDSQRVHVTGNLKFDLAVPPDLDQTAGALRAGWGERPVWVAGSTHPGEENIVVAAHRQVLKTRPDALLILVPRHPERAARVLGQCTRAGLAAARMESDSGDRVDAGVSTLVVARMGILLACYRAADACFVGGSLVPGIGGHNLLEPALAEKPVLTGPLVADQARVCEGLREAGALIQVKHAQDLAGRITALLADSGQARAMGNAGARHVAAGRGALEATLELLEPWLDGGQPPSGY